MLPIRDHIPTRRAALVTYAILGINVLVFIFELLLDSAGELSAFFTSWGVVPARLLGNFSISEALTLVTSMFLHDGPMHIIGNMLYLWIFSDNVEDMMGRGRFVLFYLLCGIAASMAQVLAGVGSTIPAIGASGAIAGVLGAYLLLFPNARVDTLVTWSFFARIRTLPAIVVLGFWFVLQFLNSVLSFGVGQVGGVAVFAHIGGFLFGLLTVKLFVPRGMRPPEPRRTRYL